MKIKNILWIAQTRIHPSLLDNICEGVEKVTILSGSKKDNVELVLFQSKKDTLSKIEIKYLPGVKLLPIYSLIYSIFHRNYDLIFTESPTFGGLGGIIAKLVLGKPLVVKIGIFFEDYFLKSVKIKNKFILKLVLFLLNRTLHFVYKNSDLIITDNVLIENDIRRYSQNSNVKICTPYGIDVDLFRHPENTKEKKILRKKHALPTDKIIGIFVGRFTGEKGGSEFLIKAIKEINKKVNNFHLVLFGRGELKKRYEKIIRELNLSNVELRDQIPHKTVAEIMRASDIYIQPSLTEGHGIAPLEAMASELLVVATHVGGLKLTVKENKTGFSVEYPNDPKSYQKKLLKAINKIQEKDFAIQKRGREFVQENYEANLIKNRLKSLIESVAK